jgi:hypothetical protein
MEMRERGEEQWLFSRETMNWGGAKRLGWLKREWIKGGQN